MFSLFAVILIGMSVVGWRNENNDLAEHGQPPQSYTSYLVSGDFAEGVFENWESEFLQMWALVVLTVMLRQKGSSESKKVRGTMPQDASSRYSIIRAANWQQRGKAIKHGLYAHSLSLTLLALFLLSFWFHALGATSAHNADAELHGSEQSSVAHFITSAEFWYQSLQNWQSEFLAVGTLLLLTIHLRERGSEQSKPVGKRYDKQTAT